MTTKLPEPGTNAQGEKYNPLPVGSDYPTPPRLDLGAQTTSELESLPEPEPVNQDVAPPLPSGGNSLLEWERKFGGQKGR